MSSKIILLAMRALMVLIIGVSGCTAPAPVPTGGSELQQACTNSGGTIIVRSCCLSVSDFPNTCLIGACACSLENSHHVNVCKCGEGECFDGTECTISDNPEQGCIDSGGTVATSSCCLSATDFPNTCLIGACGCSAENSKQIKTCDCGPDICFNGDACVVTMKFD